VVDEFIPRGFAQKIELGWKSFLCGPLRISAFSALMGLQRRGPQRYAEAAEKTYRRLFT